VSTTKSATKRRNYDLAGVAELNTVTVNIRGDC